MKNKRGYYDMLVKACATWPSEIATRVYNNGLYDTYTYSELYGVCEYIAQNLQLLQCTQGLIGIVSSKNAIIPSIIAAVHKYSTAFMFLGSIIELSSIEQYLKFKVIITITDKEEIFNNHKPDKIITIFNLVISFFVVNSQECNAASKKYSFIAQTSGSTGKPKYIQVPLKCIQPNIEDFTKLFKITTKDVIYFSTPLTFDPSMVEILLACQNGASLLIAPENVVVLLPNISPHSITFWQTTPSKFFQLSNKDINRIFSENSRLKILALGGEPLQGINKIKELKDKNNQTKIFTLYGVTEMSCWASAAELDLNKYTNNDVPLGNCLSETKLYLKPCEENYNIGRILLESQTRKCAILNNEKVTPEEYIDTGDLGEIIKGKIYYRGRNDNIIKRFGHKINLQIIESTAMMCHKITCCSCIWIPRTMLIIMYFSSESINSIELNNFLKQKLDHSNLPDKIIRIYDTPVNKHGKLCKQSLLTLYENSSENVEPKNNFNDAFINELKLSLNSDISLNEIKEKDFNSIGGTSFLAVLLCNRLTTDYPDESKIILPYLLSHKYSLGVILGRVKRQSSEMLPKIKVRRKRSRLSVENITKKPLVNIAFKHGNISKVWHYNTGRCVDASPSVYQSDRKVFVIVGSHSGKLVSLEALSGKLCGEITMTSRIEAQVCIFINEEFKPCGVTGTYDGSIVCFLIEDCSVLWTCNVGVMIKSKAVYWNGLIYIAAYDGNIRCINSSNGQSMNVINVSKQAISSDLVLAADHVLTGSLAGECASIHVASNTVVWKKTLGSPIFASPVVYNDSEYVIFAEVSGMIHCFSVVSGVEIWKYTGAKGNIFSSLTIIKRENNFWQAVFGCHDNHIYSLNITSGEVCLRWRVDMHSPVYSTPNIIHGDIIVAVSTKGKLCMVQAAKGAMLQEYLIDGEVFSSPGIFEDYIFVGCRNDKLYSLKFQNMYMNENEPGNQYKC